MVLGCRPDTDLDITVRFVLAGGDPPLAHQLEHRGEDDRSLLPRARAGEAGPRTDGSGPQHPHDVPDGPGDRRALDRQLEVAADTVAAGKPSEVDGRRRLGPEGTGVIGTRRLRRYDQPPLEPPAPEELDGPLQLLQ